MIKIFSSGRGSLRQWRRPEVNMNDLESRQEKAARLWRMVFWLAAVAVLFVIWLSNPINETRMWARWKEIQALVH